MRERHHGGRRARELVQHDADLDRDAGHEALACGGGVGGRPAGAAGAGRARRSAGVPRAVRLALARRPRGLLRAASGAAAFRRRGVACFRRRGAAWVRFDRVALRAGRRAGFFPLRRRAAMARLLTRRTPKGDPGDERGLLLVASPGRPGLPSGLGEARAAAPRRASRSALPACTSSSFSRMPMTLEPGPLGASHEGVAEQLALGFVHAHVDGQDLGDRPAGMPVPSSTAQPTTSSPPARRSREHALERAPGLGVGGRDRPRAPCPRPPPASSPSAAW